MNTEQVEGLKAQRASLAVQLQEMLDTPEAARPTKPSALRTWLRELETMQHAVDQLDQLLKRADRLQAQAGRAAARASKSAATVQADDVVLLATIPKSMNAEVRVLLQTWKGRRTIDVRCWAAIDGLEMKPTRKGLQLDVKRLPALLDALRKAEQYV